ncbi:MAG: sulfite oxidase-like oxidoreductase [bacterium]|nr:sulfite oxidase-like oxidoreductase [bacterium]
MSRPRVPPGQRVTPGFPILHHGGIPAISRRDWRLRVHGEVAEPVELDWAGLTALPATRVEADLHCVTGWSKLGTAWEGLAATELVRLARPRSDHLLVHAPGGWSTNLTLADFTAPGVLLAYRHEGKLLTREHGGPVRLVVPQLYFWKSAKWVIAVEFTATEHPGFWEKAGYHLRGDPWREQRYRNDPAWTTARRRR